MEGFSKSAFQKILAEKVLPKKVLPFKAGDCPNFKGVECLENTKHIVG